MKQQLEKQHVINKTIMVGGLTLVSRLLAIIRELLVARFLGVGALSDAFIVAFRVPNLLRQVFAEGALNGSFVPQFVRLLQEERRQQACKLTTLALIVFSGTILLLYGLVLWQTAPIIGLLAPGFDAQRVALAVPFLRVLFPFLLCICISALFNGALQSVHQFIVPALGTPIWNSVTIMGLAAALYGNLDPIWVCVGMIAGAALQCSVSLIWYLRNSLQLCLPDRQTWCELRTLLHTFGPSFLGASVSEINFLISGLIASYLPTGSVSLLYLGSRFVNIPLGVFAVALSTVLLPHFSKIVIHSPSRFKFYLLEVAKLVTWVIILPSLGLIYMSHTLFFTFIGTKAASLHVTQGSYILILYTIGLPFLCINKNLLSMLYALKDTRSTMHATIVCTLVNIVGDLVGTTLWGNYGIAAANTLAAASMTICCLYALHVRHKINLYPHRFASFFARYGLQLLVLGLPSGYITHYVITTYLVYGSVLHYVSAATYGLILLYMLYATRKQFGIKLHFLP